MFQRTISSADVGPAGSNFERRLSGSFRLRLGRWQGEIFLLACAGKPSSAFGSSHSLPGWVKPSNSIAETNMFLCFFFGFIGNVSLVDIFVFFRRPKQMEASLGSSQGIVRFDFGFLGGSTSHPVP